MFVIAALVTATAAVFAYALLRGDRAIRTAAAAGFAIFVLTAALQLLTGWRSIWPVIAADLGYGVLLVILAAIYPRRWLYAEVVLCALLLLVHAFLLEDGVTVTPLYRALNNTLALAMTAVLCGATFIADRRRRR